MLNTIDGLLWQAGCRSNSLFMFYPLSTDEKSRPDASIRRLFSFFPRVSPPLHPCHPEKNDKASSCRSCGRS